MLRKEKWKMALSLLSMVLFFYVCYVRETEVSLPGQEQILETRAVGTGPTPPQREQRTNLSGCIVTTRRLQFKMSSANWTWQMGEESPLMSPEMLAFSSTFLSLPPLSKEQFTALHCYKTQQLFKTGCLSEASFPSNKQSAKPDFGRQSGSTRVTLFPHPVSWSIRAPEGVWAARRWEDSGLR